MSDELLLVDLSSIIHPIYAMSASEPNPNHCAQATVARVHALANGHAHAAICCDSGRSFRHDLDAAYKANRPARDEVLVHQTRLAIEALEADGFPVWSAPGFEADDVIATATAKALALAETRVVIVTADKDLLQLVGPRVTAKSARDGATLDTAAVVAKFGVRPEQMADYLCLVGDSSDNVKGAEGIGPKKASMLLAKFGSLDVLFDDLVNVGAGALEIPPAMAASLRAFQPRLAATRQLIRLRTDVDIPFETLLRERRVPAAAAFMAEPEATEEPAVVGEAPPAAASEPSRLVGEGRAASAAVVTEEAATEPQTSAVSAPGGVVHALEVVEAPPPEWERQLEPRSMRDAKVLAQHMFESRLFSAHGTPQAVLATVMAGRELGLQAMASLRAFHIIDGKPSLSADLIRALVIRSGLAEYFRCTERTDRQATFVTRRRGEPNEVSLTFTLDEARQAWTKDDGAWLKSGWGHNPKDMLVARAGAKLARLIYPDVVHGVYTPEELLEIRESREAVAS